MKTARSSATSILNAFEFNQKYKSIMSIQSVEFNGNVCNHEEGFLNKIKTFSTENSICQRFTKQFAFCEC